MAQISLDINGRAYRVTCDDGQEDHLRKLAKHLDERVRELAVSVGPVGEPRLLVMASLLIADELYEAYKQIHALEAGAAGSGTEAAGFGADGDATAAALDLCAQRIEAIAARLGGA